MGARTWPSGVMGKAFLVGGSIPCCVYGVLSPFFSFSLVSCVKEERAYSRWREIVRQIEQVDHFPTLMINPLTVLLVSCVLL